MATRVVRDALVDPEYVTIVKPDGHFYHAPVAVNLNDSVIKKEDGEVVLRAWARKKGYMLLPEAADNERQCKLLERFFEADRRSGGKMKLPDKQIPKKVADLRKKAADAAAEFDFKAALAEIDAEA